ncbi:MAG: hypothetical protein ACRD3Q_21080 [Terriglobales bacterium]
MGMGVFGTIPVRHYDFARDEKIEAAMETGFAAHVWSLEELVSLLEHNEGDAAA